MLPNVTTLEVFRNLEFIWSPTILLKLWKVETLGVDNIKINKSYNFQKYHGVITLSCSFTKIINQYLYSNFVGSVDTSLNLTLPEDPFLNVNDIFRPHTTISCVRVDVQTDKTHWGFQSITKRNNITFRKIHKEHIGFYVPK